MDEIQNQTSQTPIEIALGIDKDGKTTARKLYEFLEMDASHYSRWVKTNITDNPFAIENEDYEVLATDGENSPSVASSSKNPKRAEGIQKISSFQPTLQRSFPCRARARKANRRATTS